jgi:hypothetical protein
MAGFGIDDILLFDTSSRQTKKSRNDRLEKGKNGVRYFLYNTELARYNRLTRNLVINQTMPYDTTKRRLNKLLRGVGFVRQKNYQWYFYTKGTGAYQGQVDILHGDTWRGLYLHLYVCSECNEPLSPIVMDFYEGRCHCGGPAKL